MTQATMEHTVLVVDDDPDIVLGLQDLLDHDGYQVGIARSCAEAISLARLHHYNAVLLDLGLPDGDGSDVLHTLLELNPNLPVIILTAYTATERTIGSLHRAPLPISRSRTTGTSSVRFSGARSACKHWRPRLNMPNLP